MSKPMLVTLPCVLLLLDWWPLARLNRSNVWKIVREKISFLVLTVASCVATVIAQHQSGALRPASQYPIIERVGNAALAYVRYLGKTFWPVDLAVYYPYPTQTPWAQMFVAAVLFAGLTFLIYRWSRNRPFLIVGWLWFAGMLVPVIGLVQVGGQSLADRYTYLPSIGLLVVLVFGAHELLTIKAGTAGRIIFPVVAMILVAYSLRTRDQLQHWRDTEKLFRHALAVTRENEVAHNNLGAWLATEGRYAEAMQHYEQALRINPAYADARNNLGTSLAAGNRFEEAIAQYKFALRADPRHADAHRGIGSAYFALGRIAEAEKHFQTAFQLEPPKRTMRLPVCWRGRVARRKPSPLFAGPTRRPPIFLTRTGILASS